MVSLRTRAVKRALRVLTRIFTLCVFIAFIFIDAFTCTSLQVPDRTSSSRCYWNSLLRRLNIRVTSEICDRDIESSLTDEAIILIISIINDVTFNVSLTMSTVIQLMSMLTITLIRTYGVATAVFTSSIPFVTLINVITIISITR